MNKRMAWAAVLSMAALGAPGWAKAYSLGDIQVESALGQPFSAEIPLIPRPGEKVKEIAVSVGDVGDYAVLEMQRPSLVASLETKIIRAGSEIRIVLTSRAPITEPYFNLLLRTSVGRGALFRNYPVFLEVGSPKRPTGGGV
ncbi:MAG: hypothetical protein HQL51_10855, partial [Magnetococcales bacterium]|nr:hypothetical protein [Magnetococcales bacterium]